MIMDNKNIEELEKNAKSDKYQNKNMGYKREFRLMFFQQNGINL